MSNVNQLSDVAQETNQDTPEVCIFSEDISSSTYHANRSERIISRIEGRHTTDDENTEIIEIVIDTEGEDGEFNVSIAELIKSSQSKSEDDHFKEPLTIKAPKGKGKKTKKRKKSSQTNDLNITKLPQIISHESPLLGSDLDIHQLPQIITQESTLPGSDININKLPNIKTPESNLADSDLNINKLPHTPESTLPCLDSSINKPPHLINPESTLSNSENLPKDSQLSTSTNVVRHLNGSSSSQNNIKPQENNVQSEPVPTSSTTNVPVSNRKRVNLYALDTGPQMYQAKGNLVTRPIITKNLPKVFQYLPIYGKPAPNTTLEEFYTNKVRDFVGFDLNDEEFEDLENYCSPELLKTGKELQMQTSVPVMGLLNSSTTPTTDESDPPNLVTLKKFKLRLQKDKKGLYIKKLKYRGVRMLPYGQDTLSNAEESNESITSVEPDEELEPGLDVIYQVRMYRPYAYNMVKDRYTRSRHSVFCCDVLVTGRHTLTSLRDRFVCHNDFDLRVDVSANPDTLPSAKAKEVFPSGFLFINNVFYVDSRDGCVDHSAPIRKWARARNLGDFPARDMGQTRLHQLTLKLGYPEVYVHQGNCEHVFVFSEVRLLSACEPLRASCYPLSTAIAQNQTVYCTTCAEFSAKWIVVGSDRVPFDPGFFCDTCFKQYMYKDAMKIGNFKAYRYRGNALNVLKPHCN